jgi:hypothetical protein
MDRVWFKNSMWGQLSVYAIDIPTLVYLVSSPPAVVVPSLDRTLNTSSLVMQPSSSIA